MVREAGHLYSPTTAARVANGGRRGTRVLTAAAALVAGGATYVGVAVVLSLISANRDVKSVAGGVGYITAAVVGPALVGWRDRWAGRATRWAALRTAATISILVHLFLVPIALSAMAM